MAITDFLHPLWKNSFTDNDRNSVNKAILKGLQAPLTQAQLDLLGAKEQLYITTASGEWLDYWGKWFGLHRHNQDDDTYRKHLLKHVMHPRNTVKALRYAIADFLKTDVTAVRIYEPFRDILYFNDGNLTSTKYMTNTYYRMAVIDVKIDVPYPQEVVDIINLFRPAGVLWVLSTDINSYNVDAPLLVNDLVTSDELDLDIDLGLTNHTSYQITPIKDNTAKANLDFILNEPKSLTTGDHVYYLGDSAFHNHLAVGKVYYPFQPLINDTYFGSRLYLDPTNTVQNANLSAVDGRSITFDNDLTVTNLVDYTNITQQTNFSWQEQPQFNATTVDLTTPLTSGNYQVVLKLPKPLSKPVTCQNGNVGFTIPSDTITVYSSILTVPDKTTIKTLTFSEPLTFSYFAIRKVDDTLPITFNNNEPSKLYGLGGVVSPLEYLMSNGVLNINKNNIDSSFSYKCLTMRAKAQRDLTLTPTLYNFTNNVWVKYPQWHITSNYQTFALPFVQLKPFMNDNGLIYFTFLNEDLTPLTIDYLGFSLYSETMIKSKMLLQSQDFVIE